MAQLEFFKQKTKIRFMATRKWWYTLSGVFIAASLFALWKRRAPRRMERPPM